MSCKAERAAFLIELWLYIAVHSYSKIYNFLMLGNMNNVYICSLFDMVPHQFIMI